MFARRPGRIRGFNYIGLRQVFRNDLHAHAETCVLRWSGYRASADDDSTMLCHVRVCNYCLLLYAGSPSFGVAASTQASDFQRFMNNWKQRTGYEFKQRTGESLWQESYFDHVLRDDEETNTAGEIRSRKSCA